MVREKSAKKESVLDVVKPSQVKSSQVLVGDDKTVQEGGWADVVAETRDRGPGIEYCGEPQFSEL